MLDRCWTKTVQQEKSRFLHTCSCGYAGVFPQSLRLLAICWQQRQRSGARYLGCCPSLLPSLFLIDVFFVHAGWSGSCRVGVRLPHSLQTKKRSLDAACPVEVAFAYLIPVDQKKVCQVKGLRQSDAMCRISIACMFALSFWQRRQRLVFLQTDERVQASGCAASR